MLIWRADEKDLLIPWGLISSASPPTLLSVSLMMVSQILATTAGGEAACFAGFFVATLD